MRKARFICIAIIMMVFFAQRTFFLVNKQHFTIKCVILQS